jgi:hypothetical protein
MVVVSCGYISVTGSRSSVLEPHKASGWASTAGFLFSSNHPPSATSIGFQPLSINFASIKGLWTLTVLFPAQIKLLTRHGCHPQPPFRQIRLCLITWCFGLRGTVGNCFTALPPAAFSQTHQSSHCWGQRSAEFRESLVPEEKLRIPGK